MSCVSVPSAGIGDWRVPLQHQDQGERSVSVPSVGIGDWRVILNLDGVDIRIIVSVPSVGIGDWRVSHFWTTSPPYETFQSRVSGLVIGE